MHALVPLFKNMLYSKGWQPCYHPTSTYSVLVLHLQGWTRSSCVISWQVQLDPQVLEQKEDVYWWGGVVYLSLVLHKHSLSTWVCVFSLVSIAVAVKLLRYTLDKSGLEKVKIVANDNLWQPISSSVLLDEELSKAVEVLGYACWNFISVLRVAPLQLWWVLAPFATRPWGNKVLQSPVKVGWAFINCLCYPNSPLL